MQNNNNTNGHQHPTVVNATPVMAHPAAEHHHHWQPRPVTKDEKRCCCVCTRAAVCVFIVMMCIGGASLIGVGCSKLILQTHRYTKVREYNDAVAATEADFASGSTTVATGILNITVRQPSDAQSAEVATAAHHKVTTVDSAWDAATYTSYVFTAYTTSWVDGALAKFEVFAAHEGGGGSVTTTVASESITRAIPATKSKSEKVSCNLEACVKDCEHQYSRECTKESMQTYCTNHFGSDAKYQGNDDCDGSDGTCGTCTYLGYLTRVCVVMEDKMALGFDHHLDSCFYPFQIDSQVYGPRMSSSSVNTSSIKVDFRSASDPFIAMQRITEGTMSFGHPTAYASSAATLICIGIALILVPTCAMCCYRCCCYQPSGARRHTEEGGNGSSNGGDVTSQGVVMTNQQEFNQTIPTYSAARNPAADQVHPHAVHNGGTDAEYTHAAYIKPHMQQQRTTGQGSRDETPAAAAPYGMIPEDHEGRLFGARSSVSSNSQVGIDVEDDTQTAQETQVIIEVPEKKGRQVYRQ